MSPPTVTPVARPAASPLPVGLTAEEFYEFTCRPEHGDRHFELDEGRVIEMSPPKRRHGIVCGNATGLLYEYMRRTGRGQVCGNDTGVLVARNPDTVCGPDVAFFARRLTLAEADAEEGYTSEPPLLAVEVLSPGNRQEEIARKVAQYLSAGVRAVWVIDPEVTEVTIHRASGEVTLMGAADTLDGGPELPGFTCLVGELFTL